MAHSARQSQHDGSSGASSMSRAGVKLYPGSSDPRSIAASFAKRLPNAGDASASSSAVNNAGIGLRRSSTVGTALSSKLNTTSVRRQFVTGSSTAKQGITTSSYKPAVCASATTAGPNRSTTPTFSPERLEAAHPAFRGPARAVVRSAVSGLRSPPPSSRSLMPKRAAEATAGETDRYAKRVALGNGLSSSTTFTSGLSSLSEDHAGSSTQGSARVNAKPTLKPLRSTAFPASTTLADLASTDSAIPSRRASSVFAPPGADSTSNSLALPSSSSLLSFSPSKFGLTVPREFTFSRPSPSTISRHAAPQPTSPAPVPTGLAPSPMRQDEHIPRPLMKSRMSSSLSTKLAAGRSSGTTAFALRTTGADSPVSHGERHRLVSPLKRDDLMRRTLERENSSDEAEALGSQSPSKPLMSRVTRSPSMLTTALLGESGGPIFTVQVPEAAYLQAAESTSPSYHPPALGQASLLPPMKLHPDPSSPIRHTPNLEPIQQNQQITAPQAPRQTLGNLLKRLRSPSPPSARPSKADMREADSGARKLKPRRSMMTRSLSAGQLARSLQQDDGEQTLHRAAEGKSCSTAISAEQRLTARVPATGIHRSQSTVHQYVRQASNSTMRPTTGQRTVSAPIPQLTLPDLSSPTSVTTGSSASPADSPTEQGRASTSTGDSTEESVDMDTSIMSSHGQASLANLQSLLSRMAMPRTSLSRRRSSAASHSSTMHLLDERAEIEQELLADGGADVDKGINNRGPMQSTSKEGAPRYAAATNSSSARYALSYNTSSAPNRPAATAQLREARDLGLPAGGNKVASNSGQRKISSGVPTAMKGSLLPLASSTNAGQVAMRKSSSSPTKEMEIDRRTAAVVGDPVKKIQRSTALSNVVAFVDVKTAEGDEAGGVFVEILRSLGARVLARPTDSITHIVYKGGRPSTLTRYRAYRDPKPFLVGVGWIVACRETDTRVAEKKFVLDANGLEGVLLDNMSKSTGGKRRRSLEPRVLLKHNQNVAPSPVELPDVKMAEDRTAPTLAGALPRLTPSKNIFGTHLSVSNGRNGNNDLDRARRRTLQFAPKIGSPLKQRVFNAFEVDEEGIEED